MAICVFINTTSLGVLLLIYPFVTAPIGYTVSLCIFVSWLHRMTMLKHANILREPLTSLPLLGASCCVSIRRIGG